MLTPFEKLPAAMRNDAVRHYYDLLAPKRGALFAKRVFDIVVSLLMLILLSPLLLVITVCIKLDSKGSVFYRQERYTRDMRVFRIFKFRTMVQDADKRGPLVTLDEDIRITKVGRFLRRARLDELPQLLNVLGGSMSFVGTRPEVGKYVEHYTDEMLATLLLPAGVTSRTSIAFKDEAEMLTHAADADAVYVSEILPIKMQANFKYLETFGFWDDLRIMISTVFAVGETEMGSTL